MAKKKAPAKTKEKLTRRKSVTSMEDILFNLCGVPVWLKAEVYNEAAGELLVHITNIRHITPSTESGDQVLKLLLKVGGGGPVSLNRDYVLARSNV